MGIVLKNQDERSKLQEKVTAELREKIAREQGAGPDPKPDTPDFVKDSEYVKYYQKKPMKNGRIIGIVVASVIVLALIGIVIAIS